MLFQAFLLYGTIGIVGGSAFGFAAKKFFARTRWSDHTEEIIVGGIFGGTFVVWSLLYLALTYMELYANHLIGLAFTVVAIGGLLAAMIGRKLVLESDWPARNSSVILALLLLQIFLYLGESRIQRRFRQHTAPHNEILQPRW